MILFLLARIALADVVNPEPTNCPPGSIGTTSHSGEWCTPEEACDPATCEAECRSSGLCVTEEELPCGGMVEDTDCTFIKREAHSRCSDQGDCDVGTCIVEDRCVESGPLSCGGCATTSPGGAAALVGFLLLAFATAGRRP